MEYYWWGFGVLWYCGIVTSFEVLSTYLEQFEVQNVGYIHHNELWVPAEELANFNTNIQGRIQIEAIYYGDQFRGFEENVGKQIGELIDLK